MIGTSKKKYFIILFLNIIFLLAVKGENVFSPRQLINFDSGWKFNLGEVDSIGVLNKKYNDNYEIYLSAKNQDLKNKAEAKFATSNDDFNKLRSTYSKDLSDEEIVKYYQKLLTISDEMIDLYDKMTDVLDNSVTSDTFTETTLS